MLPQATHLALTGAAIVVGMMFVLWLIQFLVPSSRHAMLFVYGAWIALEIVFVAVGRKKLTAFPACARVWKGRR